MMGFTFAQIGVFSYCWISFVMCFLWGLQDSAVNTHVFEMLGFEFNHSDDAFAIYSLIQSIMSFIFQFCEAWVLTQEQFWIYTGIIGALGFLSLGCTYFFDFKPSHNAHK